MAGHEHGSMDVSENEKTFNGFIRISIWITVIVILILVFLAIVGT